MQILSTYLKKVNISLISFQRTIYQKDKGQATTKANYGFLNSSKKRTKLTILSKEDAQDSMFRSFFGRTEDTKNYFRDLLTFSIRQ